MTRKVQLHEWTGGNYQFKKYLIEEYSSGDNRREILILANVIKQIINNELTDRQRKCFTEYVINGKQLKEIREEICINESVISRHISAAKKRILKFLKYSKAVDKYV